MFRNFKYFLRSAATVFLILSAGVHRIFADSTAVVKAKSPEVQTMIPGQPAPDFKLPNQDGNVVSLADFKGKWIVLYFYPKDFTKGCSVEAHNFQVDLPKYDKANAVILGVSVDPVSSHKSFCAKEGLNFKLLADTDAVVSTLYGSVREVLGYKMAKRNTFVINPDRIVVRAFIGVKPLDHSREILAALADLQKG